jgi:mono/diheme cytochrome c family protein
MSFAADRPASGAGASRSDAGRWRPWTRRWLGLWLAGVCLAASGETSSPSPAPSPEQLEFIENRIRPLLVNECHECHSLQAKKLKGDLRLDSRAGLLKGGESGPAVVPGQPDVSRLIQAVRYQDEDTAMPPQRRLSPSQVADLEAWVRMGAPWPEAGTPAPPSPESPGLDWAKLRADHWAFRPPSKPTPPNLGDDRWAQGPIDQFVGARLAAAGLKPAPRASPRILIRRAYLGLTGLPPTPQAVSAFEADPSPDAWTRVVDALLASPQYGERWGRHWLDVARYSDGLGGALDPEPLPEAWRFRDWVVSALNHDLPYHHFVQAQIAGDLLSDDRELAVATGFFAVGPTYVSDGGDPEATAQAQAETLADRVDTFSRAFLGLTVACARCHDHKFDPITTRDYYALAGIFNNSKAGLGPLVPSGVVAAYDAGQKAIHDLEAQLKAAGTNVATQPQVPQLQAALDQRKRDAPPAPPRAHLLTDSGSTDMAVALRGDLRRPGEPAPRRFLQILAGEQAPLFKSGSGRRELAAAVVDPTCALTARVLVNRVWKHHFGQALARTPSNFGVMGEKPTHPELLEWLAATLIESEWSWKQLHRRILLSATWQMSSQYSREAFEQDGENRLLWRMNPRQMEVEIWRDSLLAVTGELDRTLGGRPTDQILESPRRTLYGTISRNGDRFASDEFLRLFDFPAPRTTSEQRSASTVPQQHLFMLNSPFMAARAAALARRLHRESPRDDSRIQLAYQSLFSRLPTPAELQLGLAFVADPARETSPARWEAYAQVLLASHEFRQIQ